MQTPPTRAGKLRRTISSLYESVAPRLDSLLLPAALAVQASLLLYDLDRLPAWGDEHDTLFRASLSPGELLEALRGVVHPPLYYWIAQLWMKLPGWTGELVQLRALSVLFALAGLVVFDRLWLREAGVRTRRWFLLLWVVSPYVLLYGRMARSYSLQLLLAVVTLHAARALFLDPRSPRRIVGHAVSATLLLYAHYLPGLSVFAGVALDAVRRSIRERDRGPLVGWTCSALLVLLAYAPWLPRFVESFTLFLRVQPTRLGGNELIDLPASLVYAVVSFGFGEALPPKVLLGALVVLPGMVFLLAQAASSPPRWSFPVLSAAGLAYAGATQWVSFAFVGARLMFVYPFFLLWLLRGRARRPAAGNPICFGLACVALAGIQAYFAVDGFLNKAYVLPVRSIAASIIATSAKAGAVVFADHHTTDLESVRLYLPARVEVVTLYGNESPAEIRAMVERRTPPSAWLAAGTRNPFAEQWRSALEAELGPPVGRRFFLPYSVVDRAILRWTEGREPPRRAIVLWEFQAEPN